MSNENQIDYERGIKKIFFSKKGHIHIAGILGASMSGIAKHLSLSGHIVTGSDSAQSPSVRQELSEYNIMISNGNSAEYMCGAMALVISSAISTDSPEVIYAKKHGIPILFRHDVLGAIISRYKEKIGVAGTHGKSTTSSMIKEILVEAGKLPTAFIGLPSANLSYTSGGRDVVVYEACEYKNAFLSLTASLAVITGVELDHTDCFSSLGEIMDSFIKFADAADRVLVNVDFQSSSELASRTKSQTLTYGSDASANYRYHSIEKCAVGTKFSVDFRSGECREFYIPQIGEYNVSNATAAIATADILGVDEEIVRAALLNFNGIPKRLEYIGSLEGRKIYLDYAHHPTEIFAAIRALMETTGNVHVVHIPHTYSRTRDLWEEFKNSLSIATRVTITDIFPAREPQIEGITAERLASEIDGAEYIPLQSLHEYIISQSEKYPLVLMGAGDFDEVISRLHLHITK